MALSADTGGLHGYDLYSASNIHEDLRDVVDLIGPAETPFLARIGFGGEPATNTKIDWAEDELHAISTLTTEALDNSETGVDVTATTGTEFYEGSIIEVDDGSDAERMIVTASAANSLTVARGQCGTSATTHDTGATVRLLGHTSYDNTDITTDKTKTASIKSNYVQPILIPLEITEIGKAVNSVKGADIWQYEKEIRLKEALRSLEIAALRGAKQSSSPQGSGSVMSTMDGCIALVSTNETAASSATLTEAHLRAAMKTSWDNGSSVNLGVCNAFQAEQISSWMEGRVRQAVGESRVGSVVTQYVCEYGSIDIMLNRYMPNDTVLLVDPSKIQLRPMIPWTYFEVARTGTAEKGFVYGVYSLELRNEKQHAKITGLATS